MIKAYTFVILSVDSLFELYTTTKPSVGEEFSVRHIKTKKVVHEAKVVKVENYSTKPRMYKVIARVES